MSARLVSCISGTGAAPLRAAGVRGCTTPRCSAREMHVLRRHASDARAIAVCLQRGAAQESHATPRTATTTHPCEVWPRAGWRGEAMRPCLTSVRFTEAASEFHAASCRGKQRHAAGRREARPRSRSARPLFSCPFSGGDGRIRAIASLPVFTGDGRGETGDGSLALRHVCVRGENVTHLEAWPRWPNFAI